MTTAEQTKKEHFWREAGRNSAWARCLECGQRWNMDNEPKPTNGCEPGAK